MTKKKKIAIIIYLLMFPISITLATQIFAKYVDAFGNTKNVYAWRLTPTDPTPKGKREKVTVDSVMSLIR